MYLATWPSNRVTTAATQAWYACTTSRRSSGSRRAENSVEATRAQNRSVSCRRSGSTRHIGGPRAAARLNTSPALFSHRAIQTLSTVPRALITRDTELTEITSIFSSSAAACDVKCATHVRRQWHPLKAGTTLGAAPPAVCLANSLTRVSSRHRLWGPLPGHRGMVENEVNVAGRSLPARRHHHNAAV